MKRSGCPKSTWLHNEMDVRKVKTTITCGLCKHLGHNRRSQGIVVALYNTYVRMCISWIMKYLCTLFK